MDALRKLEEEFSWLSEQTAQPPHTWEETPIESMPMAGPYVPPRILHRAYIYQGDHTLGLREKEDDPLPACWPTPGAWNNCSDK